MNAIVSRFTRLTIRQRLMLLTVVAMFVMPLAAFAQVTPEAPDSGEMITAAGTAMNTWNLWAFAIAFMVAALALFVLRGFRRVAR